VERDKAIAELRREAVDLAIAGASKVVEQNLDSDKNRKLVESFLSSLSIQKS
jgi:F-type H+-transporting ATPase subunit b